MGRYVKSGKFTVEAAFIMPLIIGFIWLQLFFIFYMNDRITVKAYGIYRSETLSFARISGNAAALYGNPDGDAADGTAENEQQPVLIIGECHTSSQDETADIWGKIMALKNSDSRVTTKLVYEARVPGPITALLSMAGKDIEEECCVSGNSVSYVNDILRYKWMEAVKQ